MSVKANVFVWLKSREEVICRLANISLYVLTLVCAVFILGCALMVFGVFLDPRKQN